MCATCKRKVYRGVLCSDHQYRCPTHATEYERIHNPPAGLDGCCPTCITGCNAMCICHD